MLPARPNRRLHKPRAGEQFHERRHHGVSDGLRDTEVVLGTYV
jgi:hypothetical protein